MFTRLRRFSRGLRAFPRQFWVLTIGIFIYVGAAALAFPFEAIYLRQNLHTSMTMIGVVFGLVPLAVMPVQFWGGHLTDRLGRRKVIMLSVLVGVVWFVGFAFVTELWQVAALVALESAFGWPLFQTASNAMIADLLPAGAAAGGVRHHPRRDELRRRGRAGARRPGARVRGQLPDALPLRRHGLPR